MSQSIKTAIFPVGGLGTRFLPATKSMPKEMLPVVDRPLIQYAYEEAQEAGIEHFIFITGRNKNIISNHFDHAYELQKVLDEKQKSELLSLTKDWLPPAGNIAFIRQQVPMGLGHAVSCARNFIGKEPFAVLLADEMFISKGRSLLRDMIEAYDDTGGNIIGVAEVAREDTSKYGIIAPESEENGRIRVADMVEKPKPEDAPSCMSIVGRYILQPGIFDHLVDAKTGAGGEVQLTDALAGMIETTPTYGVPFEGKRFDCGNRRGFLEANIGFALQHPEMRDDILRIMRSFVADADNKEV